MPFLFREIPIQPFSNLNTAENIDIGTIVSDQTNDHTGEIYITFVDKKGKGITLILSQQEINELVESIAHVAIIASQAIGTIQARPNTQPQ